jgi:hypothetical protein
MSGERLDGRQTVEVSLRVSVSLEIEAGSMSLVLEQAEQLGDALVAMLAAHGDSVTEEVATAPVEGVIVHDDAFLIEEESERYSVIWSEAGDSDVVSADEWSHYELVRDIAELRGGES